MQPKRIVIVLLACSGLSSLGVMKAKAGFFEDFWAGFSEGFQLSYEDGLEQFLGELEDYGLPYVETAVSETIGPLGLSDVLSLEESVLDQVQQGDHVLILDNAPRDLLGEIYGRRLAVDQARSHVSSVISQAGQQVILDKMDVLQQATVLANQDFEQASQALSSQTAIKRLGALQLRQTELLAGLSTEIINARVSDAVELDVLSGVAEQLDEAESLAWAEQRSQLESLILVGMGLPISVATEE